jgi:hypothetical protein
VSRYRANASLRAFWITPGGMDLAVEDRGELIFDEGHLPLVLHQLRKDVLGDAARPLLLEAHQGPLSELGILDARHQVVRRQREVPQLQRFHLAELSHGLAVGADAGHDHILGHSVAEAVVPAGHHEARSEALDVPLPGGRKGFVQVVDGEDDPPLRGGKAAEIAQVGVPAALDADPRDRGGCEVRGHGERGAPVEGERRSRHASVAQGKQVGQPPLLRFEDQLDRIGPVGGGLPGGVGASRAGVAQSLPGGAGLVPGKPLRRYGPLRGGWSFNLDSCLSLGGHGCLFSFFPQRSSRLRTSQLSWEGLKVLALGRSRIDCTHSAACLGDSGSGKRPGLVAILRKA